MRKLTRDPNAAAKARAAEQRANEEAGLKSINISTTAAPQQKKKPVFKSTLQPHNAAKIGVEAKPMSVGGVVKEGEGDPSGAVRNGWVEDRYQPRFVTGCEDEECGLCSGGRLDIGVGDVEMVGS